MKYVNFTFKKNGRTVSLNEKVAKIYEKRGRGTIGKAAPAPAPETEEGGDEMSKEEKYQLLKDSGVEGLGDIDKMDEKDLDKMIEGLDL